MRAIINIGCLIFMVLVIINCYIVKDADKLGRNGVVERAQECLWILQEI